MEAHAAQGIKTPKNNTAHDIGVQSPIDMGVQPQPMEWEHSLNMGKQLKHWNTAQTWQHKPSTEYFPNVTKAWIAPCGNSGSKFKNLIFYRVSCGRSPSNCCSWRGQCGNTRGQCVACLSSAKVHNHSGRGVTAPCRAPRAAAPTGRIQWSSRVSHFNWNAHPGNLLWA